MAKKSTFSLIDSHLIEIDLKGFRVGPIEQENLLSRSSRNWVSKSSQAATSPMVTMRKPTQKTRRRLPMITDPVLVEHLKQQLSTIAILNRIISFQAVLMNGSI